MSHIVYNTPSERAIISEEPYTVACAGSVSDISDRHAASYQAYTDAKHRALLDACGFVDARVYPSLIGVPDETQAGLCVIVARKDSERVHECGLEADVG
jgi:hypothetical protein